MACGCLAEGWGVQGSIQVVVMQVDLVACFDLFVFMLVRFALLFHLFSVFGFWHRVFGEVKVSALVVRELRGCLFDFCRESCGPITFDSMSGASL